MFRRVGQYVCEFLGLSPSGREPNGPELVLAQLQEELRAQLAHYNQSLAASARFCEVLKEQIKGLGQREGALRAALEAHVRKGSSEREAGQLALNLDSLSEELSGLREQLKEAAATCEHINGARDDAIATARKKLEALRGTLSEQQLRQAITDAIAGARAPQ
jgi:hypothetical protein